jgi:hypothetical protein
MRLALELHGAFDVLAGYPDVVGDLIDLIAGFRAGQDAGAADRGKPFNYRRAL